MTTPELAKVCMTMAHQLGLTLDKREEFAVEIMKLSLFDAAIPTRVEYERSVAEAAAPTTERPVSSLPTPPKRTTTPTTSRGAKRRGGKPQERETPRKLLCRAGTKSHCDKCAKPLYTVLSDIYDGLPALDFAAKFLPIGHGKTIPIPTRLRAVDGCVMTDCPVCGGDMSLILWGKKPDRDFDEGAVSSIGGVE